MTGFPLVAVVGGSIAGLKAAQAARAAGSEVVVVGAEARLPYSRPPLTKDVLSSEREPEAYALPGFDIDATWMLGRTATGLDPGAHVISIDDGTTLCYDRVVVATGSRPRRWQGVGRDLPEVVTVRDADDAMRLRALFQRRPRVIVLGGGLLGCEVASSAAKRGLTVTLIELAPTLMAVFGDVVAARLGQLHEQSGVDVRLGTRAAAIVGENRVEGVELEDGEWIPAEVVVVAVGAVPNTEWLRESGLPLDDAGGLVCDATLTVVGSPDVLCAGDVASWPHPLGAGGRIRVEHWTNADEQGFHAGQNAAVAPQERGTFESVPYFWTDQHGVKVQVLGIPSAADRIEILEATDSGDRFVGVGIRDAHVVAAIAWNAVRRLGVYQRAIAAGLPWAELAAEIAADEHALGYAAAVR